MDASPIVTHSVSRFVLEREHNENIDRGCQAVSLRGGQCVVCNSAVTPQPIFLSARRLESRKHRRQVGAENLRQISAFLHQHRR